MSGAMGPSVARQVFNVAVLGAGAAGIAAAKELRAEGHTVHVLEQASTLGGTWVLEENTESDLLGQDLQRSVVHSSMYSSLRTNLPREVMSFYDYPFAAQLMKGQSRDARRFPHHSEVLSYLHVYANHFNVMPHIQFNTRVLSVLPVLESLKDEAPSQQAMQNTPPANHLHAANSFSTTKNATAPDQASGPAPVASACEGVKWKVLTTSSAAQKEQLSAYDIQEATYDAVLVCSGHYSAPRIPEVKGLHVFPGRCEHSHNYRCASNYTGKRVVVVGAHASGVDISCEVARRTAVVHFSAATWKPGTTGTQQAGLGDHSNIYRCGWLRELTAEGDVILQDGERIPAVDVVIFCTGYHFSFPFLGQEVLDTCHDYVHPLYQHMMAPRYGPSLSFIGLPLLVAPFLMFSLQSMYVARMLSGKVKPPDTSEMHTWIDKNHRDALAAGVKPRHIHLMNTAQWEYLRWVADQAGVARVPKWREQLWSDTLNIKGRLFGDSYRDAWDTDMQDSVGMQQAHAWTQSFEATHLNTPS